MCNRLDTIPACDRRTSCDGIVRAMRTRRAVKRPANLVMEVLVISRMYIVQTDLLKREAGRVSTASGAPAHLS